MKPQNGFTIIAALMVLFLLGLFGSALTMTSSLTSHGNALDVDGSLSYQSSKAGIEWGLFQIQNPIAAPACFSSTSFVLTGGLSRFTVTIQCNLTTVSDGSQILNMYTLTSNACNNPTAGTCPGTIFGPFSVQRQLRVSTYR